MAPTFSALDLWDARTGHASTGNATLENSRRGLRNPTPSRFVGCENDTICDDWYATDDCDYGTLAIARDAPPGFGSAFLCSGIALVAVVLGSVLVASVRHARRGGRSGDTVATRDDVCGGESIGGNDDDDDDDQGDEEENRFTKQSFGVGFGDRAAQGVDPAHRRDP